MKREKELYLSEQIFRARKLLNWMLNSSTYDDEMEIELIDTIKEVIDWRRNNKL